MAGRAHCGLGGDPRSRVAQAVLRRLGSPADLAELAAEQEGIHRRRLTAYRDLDAQLDAAGINNQARTTLQLGLRYEAVAVEFWREVGGTA